MSVFRLQALRNPVIRRIDLRTSCVSQRSFQSASRLAVGKESGLHEEDRVNKIESAKQQQQQSGRKEWSDALSSDSEEIAKADRGEMKDSKDSIKELQQETAKKAEQEHGKR